jgi:hypothetical protein
MIIALNLVYRYYYRLVTPQFDYRGTFDIDIVHA